MTQTPSPVNAAPLPLWQQLQFDLLLGKLSDWRNADHEDAVAICRSDVIAILDGVKALRSFHHAQSTGTIEALVAAHSAELDRLHKMQKEIGHCDRDKGWQGGRISGLALAIEIAKSGSVIRAQCAPEPRVPPAARLGWWTHDDGSAKRGLGHLYYFAPLGATPPPYKIQRHVSAIIDIASDGTLAGVELIDDMPPPPAFTSPDDRGQS